MHLFLRYTDEKTTLYLVFHGEYSSQIKKIKGMGFLKLPPPLRKNYIFFWELMLYNSFILSSNDSLDLKHYI